MNLCQHREYDLYCKTEVRDAEPRDLTIAELHCNTSRLLVDLGLVEFLLLVELVITSLLFLQIFLILVLQLFRLLCCHNLEEAEWSSQVLQVLLDQVQLFNVFVDIVMPVTE